MSAVKVFKSFTYWAVIDSHARVSEEADVLIVSCLSWYLGSLFPFFLPRFPPASLVCVSFDLSGHPPHCFSIPPGPGRRWAGLGAISLPEIQGQAP